MRPRAPLAFALLALASLSLAQAVTIRRLPKVGEKTTYADTGTFQLNGVEITVKGTSTEEVVKVEGDLVTSKTTTKTIITLGGMDQPASESTSLSSERLDGTPVESEIGGKGPKGPGMRAAHITQLLLPSRPVFVGEAWNAEDKHDEKLGTPGYKINYKLVGDEKVGVVDAWKITADGWETEGESPTKIKATYWIDKSTGRMIRTSADATDIVFGEGAPPLTGHLEAVLQPA